MKQSIILLATICQMTTLGCASTASDEQLQEMCAKKLEVSGALRGTILEEETKRITEEYDQKEKGLRAEMERDLKGMDDVLAGRLKDIEAEGLGDAEKSEKIDAAKADIEKKKKGITDQFNPLIEKLTPQKEYALNEAGTYVEKRKKEAEEATNSCIAQAKAAEVSEALAACRVNADSPETYDACK